MKFKVFFDNYPEDIGDMVTKKKDPDLVLDLTKRDTIAVVLFVGAASCSAKLQSALKVLSFYLIIRFLLHKIMAAYFFVHHLSDTNSI